MLHEIFLSLQTFFHSWFLKAERKKKKIFFPDKDKGFLHLDGPGFRKFYVSLFLMCLSFPIWSKNKEKNSSNEQRYQVRGYSSTQDYGNDHGSDKV